MNDYDHADIESYKHTRQELAEAPPCKHKAWMMSNLDYAIEWLETGRRPGNKRGIERYAAYQRNIPTELIERYMTPPPQVSLMSSDDFERVEYILCMLTDRERECYELHIGGRMTEREIADMLGIKRTSVQEFLKRANTKIKKYKSHPVPLYLNIVI